MNGARVDTVKIRLYETEQCDKEVVAAAGHNLWIIMIRIERAASSTPKRRSAHVATTHDNDNGAI